MCYIKTENLHESSHNFEPFGDSASLLIQADLSPYNNAVLHLKESHITFHTYIEDILNNFLIVRLELHISSCSESNVFNSLPEIISLNNQKNDNCNQTHKYGFLSGLNRITSKGWSDGALFNNIHRCG